MADSAPPQSTEKISTGRKLAYGVGAISENTMQNAVGMNANQFFNVTLQVAPGLLGIAAMIFRLWDAVTDPIMGWISDRTDTRLGRRRPYIIGGALAGGVLFALIWWCPRDMDSMFYFYWYVGISLLFYTAFTVFGVPYLALGYEMSSDYHERTRIMSFRTWFQSVSGICIQWMFWMTQRDFFADTVEGMRWVGAGMGAIILMMGVAPGLFLRERPLAGGEQMAKRKAVKLKHALGAFKVRPFRLVLAALALAMIGLFTVGILGVYINIYYLYGGDVKAASAMFGWQGTAYHLCCMASIPLIAWTSARIGKKNALLLFLSIAVLGTLLKWVLFTPSNPWLQLGVPILMAPGLSAAWTLFASMTADVTDYDELANGTRREGSFGGLYGWTQKLGFALCFLIAGYVLEWIGFDAALGGDQTENTIFLMRVCYTAIPAIGLIGSMICIWHYPLDENTVRATRTKLDASTRAET